MLSISIEIMITIHIKVNDTSGNMIKDLSVHAVATLCRCRLPSMEHSLSFSAWILKNGVVTFGKNSLTT